MAEKKLMVVVGGRTTEFEKAMRGVQKTAKRTSRDLTNIGKSLTTTVTLPIAAVGGFALKSSIDFESAFAGVRKTVDASEAELAGLSEGIRDMAKEIPAAATEIAGVAEAAGQLGIQTPNILSFTRTMVDLGEATNMSAADAATALARLANITQMPQSEFDKLGSVVVALGNNLATTESEIVEMGLRLAGAGKQVGMSEAQILGFAGALSSVGIEAQAGGSAFSKVMVNMQLATEKEGTALEEFASVAGMSAKEFKKAFQTDAASAIIAFIQGLGTAEERGMSAIKVLDDMDIKEVRLRDSLLRAAGAGDLFNESIAIGTQAWGDNVALTKEAEQRYDTTASQLEILKNRLTDAGIELGDKIAPILRDSIIPLADKLIDAIGKLVDWFGTLSPETQKTIIVLAGLAAALGPVLIVVGQIVGAIANIIPVITAIGSALGPVLATVGTAVGAVAAPVLLIVAAVAAVVAIIALVIKYWDEIVAAFQTWWTGFVDFWSGVWESIKNATQAAWDWLANLFAQYTPAGLIISHWEEIKTFFANLWEAVKIIFALAMIKLRDGLIEKFNAVVGFLTGVKDKIVGVFVNVKDMVLGVWNGIVDGIKGFINLIIGAINGMIGGMNKLKWDAPDWVPLIGGKRWGINIPKIPLLDTGGLVRGPGVFQVGAGVTEVVRRYDPTDNTPRDIRHTGTIRVEGVDSQGQLSAVVDIVLEQLLQEVRA